LALKELRSFTPLLELFNASKSPKKVVDVAMIKRSVTIQGHRTSISLEAPFWDYLHEIAARRQISVSALIAEIDRARTVKLSSGQDVGGLSSTIRTHILAWARSEWPKQNQKGRSNIYF
jgi:predicted DNA-binding ribbon-helix-helix protein